MSNAKITVGIPVYNGADYIANTIQSVLNQTFTDFELVIADNCSTDNTTEIVESFKDKRITLIKNPENYGMVGNWNVCLKNSHCEFFHLLCADDLLLPNCLEEEYTAITQDSGIVMAFSASNVINSDGKVLMTRRPLKKDCVFDGVLLAKKSFRSYNLYGEPSNILYRPESLLKSGGYNTSMWYVPDWEASLRISCEGKVAYISTPLMSFRVSPSSASSSYTKNKDKIRKDDNAFIEIAKSISVLKLTNSDISAHRRSIKMRDFARRIFFILNAKKGR